MKAKIFFALLENKIEISFRNIYFSFYLIFKFCLKILFAVCCFCYREYTGRVVCVCNAHFRARLKFISLKIHCQENNKETKTQILGAAATVLAAPRRAAVSGKEGTEEH